MHFDSFSDFLAMGGYAPYVWGAFGVTFFSMFILWKNSVSQSKALIKNIQQKIDREARREAAEKMENTL